MQEENSNRIQTSIINGVERKVLIWLAKKQPRWVTSDMLTFVGTVGAIVIATGYILSSHDIRWLWLASAGFVINWYGDSLDGSLARVRQTQRPLYGFFVDHNVDGLNETIMFIGVGLSSLVHFGLAMMVLVLYLLMSIYVYISAHLKGEFRLTYAKMGPTEFRLLMIIANTLLIYIPSLTQIHGSLTFMGTTYTMALLDYVAIVIMAILFCILIYSLIHDAREYARIDPPKKQSDDTNSTKQS